MQSNHYFLNDLSLEELGLLAQAVEELYFNMCVSKHTNMERTVRGKDIKLRRTAAFFLKSRLEKLVNAKVAYSESARENLIEGLKQEANAQNNVLFINTLLNKNLVTPDEYNYIVDGTKSIQSV